MWPLIGMFVDGPYLARTCKVDIVMLSLVHICKNIQSYANVVKWHCGLYLQCGSHICSVTSNLWTVTSGTDLVHIHA